MTVKDLIENLKKIDPEKDIWVVYDGYQSFVPDFEVAEEYLGNCKPGDYVMEVG